LSIRAATHAVLAFVVAGAVGVVAPGASAETGYRYWSYWNAAPGSADGNWTYATEGSGTRVPADGALEGWRFGIAGEESRIHPSIPADFESICASQEQVEGAKRVGLVIDPGVPLHAPSGETPGAVRTECVVADIDATGFSVLAEVVDVRTDAGFVCGLDGYPASECAPLVELDASSDGAASTASTESTGSTESTESTESTAASETTRDSGASAVGTPLASAAAVSLLALVGFGIWRHSRNSQNSRKTESA
jgi:hypothetical protein